jgi:hypothetical protein
MNVIEDKFFNNGFAVFKYLSSDDYAILRSFSTNWICSLFSKNGLPLKDTQSIETYHLNPGANEKIHGDVLRAKNRHQCPPEEIKSILINSNLKNALLDIGITDYDLWDEGLGWLAFRLIRPGFNDGYPFSKKDWGPGKGTISIWVPILGFDPDQIIAFVPGSHKRKYEKFLPQSSKFTPDEFRLKGAITESEIYRPPLKQGEALIFSPKTLHTEDVTKGTVTRFSLEFRIIPKNISR